MKKIAVGTFSAYEVTVKMEGDVQTYALNFLKIFNNVKTHNSLIRVTNDYGDNVSVVCKKDALEATKDYLEWFGEIISVETVLCVSLEEDIEYDFDKYEDLVVVPYFE